MDEITDFGPTTPYWFLSNFYPNAPFVYDGIEYATNEHFYQTMKAVDPFTRAWINSAPDALQAKRRGRSKKFELIPNWDQFMAMMIMRMGLLMKFTQNPALLVKLLDTGNLNLVEGNTWDDKIWGMVLIHDEWVGRNQLGLLLMELRTQSLVTAGAYKAMRMLQ